MKRISVDIGGTFTDCFFVWDEQYIEAKALTTHHNLALGFNDALDLACSRAGLNRDRVLSEVDSVRYATTLGTNALIELKGPRVGAIVTHGFEDTIPLSRGRGYGEGLDISMQQNLAAAERPEPLVPRQLIRSVKERSTPRGRSSSRSRRRTFATWSASSSTPGPRRWSSPLPTRRRTPSTSCGSRRSSWRSTRRTSWAPYPSCSGIRCRVVKVSMCGPPRPSWMPSCTRSCSTP